MKSIKDDIEGEVGDDYFKDKKNSRYSREALRIIKIGNNDPYS